MANNNLTLTRQPTGAFVRGSEGAGTTTLTDRDARWQIFNLSAARTVVLPGDGAAGDVWQINNVGTGALTIKSSGLNTIVTFATGYAKVAALVNNPTTAANWLLGNIYSVEYAANNGPSGWDSTNTTDFSTQVTSPSGILMGGALSAGRRKRLRFATDITASDNIMIQVSTNQVLWGGQNYQLTNRPLMSWMRDDADTVNCGYLLEPVTGSTTDVDVFFGRYSYFQTDGGDLANWGSSDYWRVVKIRMS